GGALIPLLMMAALKFLPPRVKLYGLALYSLTATFASTIAVWLVGVWTDGFADWRLVYWPCVPLLALAAALAGWGLALAPAPAGASATGPGWRAARLRWACWRWHWTRRSASTPSIRAWWCSARMRGWCCWRPTWSPNGAIRIRS